MRARGEGPRRHPESPVDPGLPPAAPPAAHLRAPLARLQPPPHCEYPRPIARRPRALPLQLFFRLVLIWAPVAVIFMIIPNDTTASLPPLPVSRFAALPKLVPQAPGADECSPSCSGCCSLSLHMALRLCFPLWPPKFCSFPRDPLLLTPGPNPLLSFRENRTGTQNPQLGYALGSGALFTVCGPGTVADFEKPRSCHFPALRSLQPPPGGRGACQPGSQDSVFAS